MNFNRFKRRLLPALLNREPMALGIGYTIMINTAKGTGSVSKAYDTLMNHFGKGGTLVCNLVKAILNPYLKKRGKTMILIWRKSKPES